MKKVLITLVVLIVIVLAAVFMFKPAAKTNTVSNGTASSTATSTITLTFATHWSLFQLDGIYDAKGNLVSKGLQQYFTEYEKLHPNINIVHIPMDYGVYASKLQNLYDVGQAPDIYQVYSQWAVSYVKNGILDTPPVDIQNDVKNNYVPTAIKGVTLNGQIWGIPTETEDYALLYDKNLFKQAGIVDANGNALPPKTWSELVADAIKITKRNSAGNITTYGYSFEKGTDDFVVAPFLSLLFGENGGEYLTPDNSKCMLNSPQGVKALASIVQLFSNKVTDDSSDVWDVGSGKSAMTIMAPWSQSSFEGSTSTANFDKVVGVAPVPYLDKPGNLAYTWFMGVMNSSTHKQAAWDFLKWLTTDIQPQTGTTRYGDLMAQTIGAIPSRKSDVANETILKTSPQKAGWVSVLKDATPEPVVGNFAHITDDILMPGIESAWYGQVSPQKALDSICQQINQVLSAE